MLNSVDLVIRKPPVNLREEDLGFFEKDLEASIPRPSVKILENIEVSSEGLLFKDGRIMHESFSQAETFARWRMRSILKARVQHLIRSRTVRQRAVWVTDDWSPGYFHWFSDAIPKILIARYEVEEFGLLLPSTVQDLDFVNESLSILKIRNVMFIPPRAIVRVENLYRPIHSQISGIYNESIIRKVREIFRESVTQYENYPRVYVSRRRANKRRIANEQEIIEILKDFEFKIIETETLPLRRQIELFVNCELFVSSHGAGLMNMLFMAPNTGILEIRKADARVPNCYFNLASALGLRYYYQLCHAVDMNEAPHSANLVVDTEKFRQILSSTL